MTDRKPDKDTSNMIFILAACALVWLIFGWRAAVGLFLVVVMLTQAVVLFGGEE